MDKLAEIIKIPMLREGQQYKEYLDLLAVTLRNMLELMTQNSNTLQQIIVNEGGGGVVTHHALSFVGAAGDHTAADVTNVPYVAGAIAATNVQSAINELADEKSPTGHSHSHTTLTDIGTHTHPQVDDHLDASAPHSGHMDKPASPEQGDILYCNGSAWVRLVHGNAGESLQSGGHAANPAWGASGVGRYTVVDHTANANLAASDMNKIHTDHGVVTATIQSISNTGGVTTVTTYETHGYVDGQIVTIYGTVDFNQTTPAITATGATTFTFADTGPHATETDVGFVITDVLLTLPSSGLTNGDWVTFVRMATYNANDAGASGLIAYSAVDKHILWDADDGLMSLTWKILATRSALISASMTLVYHSSSGMWIPTGDVGKIAISWATY